MTKFTKQLLLFKDISGKKVQADFDGGEVSSDAGLLFLREVERQSGAIGRISGVLRDRRHPSYITHPLGELLKAVSSFVGDLAIVSSPFINLLVSRLSLL